MKYSYLSSLVLPTAIPLLFSTSELYLIPEHGSQKYKIKYNSISNIPPLPLAEKPGNNKHKRLQ